MTYSTVPPSSTLAGLCTSVMYAASGLVTPLPTPTRASRRSYWTPSSKVSVTVAGLVLLSWSMLVRYCSSPSEPTPTPVLSPSSWSLSSASHSLSASVVGIVTFSGPLPPRTGIGSRDALTPLNSRDSDPVAVVPTFPVSVTRLIRRPFTMLCPVSVRSGAPSPLLNTTELSYTVSGAV